MGLATKSWTLGARKADLQAAATDRLTDAEVLFAAGRFASTIAVGAYSLEIHLKVENSFKNGSDIGDSVGLSVHDWSEVNQGGAYSIPPGYVDHKELLLIPSASD